MVNSSFNLLSFATLNSFFYTYKFQDFNTTPTVFKAGNSVKFCRKGSSLFERKKIRLVKVFGLSSKAEDVFHQAPESLNGGTAILWFRNNLRLSDNKCLDLANTAEAVLPIYVFDRRSLVRNRFRQQRSGPFRCAFVKESVEQLQNNLRGHFSDLLVEVGTAATVIGNLCARYRVDHIVAPKMTSPDEEEYEKEVLQVAKELHLNVCFVWDNTLLSFDDLIATEYKNGFGEFFSSVLSKGLPKISDSDKKRPSMKPLPQGFKPSFSVPLPHLVNDLGVENLCTPYEWPFPEPRAVFAFRGGEDSALDRIEDYFTKKNGVKLLAKLEDCSGVMDSSTKLSPWISTGCISARQVYWEGYRTLEKNVDDHISNIWLKRFLWRDFLYLLCIHEGSTVFRDRTLNEDAPELPLYKKKSSNSHEFIRNRALIAWLEGSTGYPYIDAHIKELKTTGYISFRGRLNLSSFLVHQLDGEWQLGAEVFEHYLIDHDPVVNWGYWYYLYERCRDDNQEVPLDTVEEANKYDPEGFYVKKWINELVLLPPPFCHEPYLLSDEEQNLFEVVLGRDYPEPVLFPMVAKEIERARQLLSSSHSSSLDC